MTVIATVIEDKYTDQVDDEAENGDEKESFVMNFGWFEHTFDGLAQNEESYKY